MQRLYKLSLNIKSNVEIVQAVKKKTTCMTKAHANLFLLSLLLLFLETL